MHPRSSTINDKHLLTFLSAFYSNKHPSQYIRTLIKRASRMYAQMKFFYTPRTGENKRKQDECVALDVSHFTNNREIHHRFICT